MAPSGLAVGLNKGHITTKREKVARPANRKGVSTQDGAPAQRGCMHNWRTAPARPVATPHAAASLCHWRLAMPWMEMAHVKYLRPRARHCELTFNATLTCSAPASG